MNTLEAKCYLCGDTFTISGLVPIDGFGPVCAICSRQEDGAEKAAVEEAERLIKKARGQDVLL